MYEKYFDYLEALRESGKTNMFGATPYLMIEFGLDEKEAIKILIEWVEKKESEKNEIL